jgi:hypothetical protein
VALAINIEPDHRESVDHRRALDEALAEGLADAELPSVGAALKEVLGI